MNGSPETAGASVFENQRCGNCHTFSPARSRATTGPNLDRVPQSARQAGEPVEEYVRESIVNPDAYVHPGFPRNVMPPFELRDEQLDALVQYLVAGARNRTQ